MIDDPPNCGGSGECGGQRHAKTSGAQLTREGGHENDACGAGHCRPQQQGRQGSAQRVTRNPSQERD
jgi:hypothetical protein